MTFVGLIVMIRAKIYTTPDGKSYGGIHGSIHPVADKIGWGLTIIGYLLQIVGVLIT